MRYSGMSTSSLGLQKNPIYHIEINAIITWESVSLRPQHLTDVVGRGRIKDKCTNFTSSPIILYSEPDPL